MIVLGFDTATPTTAVALGLADGRTLEARDVPTENGRPGHATRLLALADGLLTQAGLEWGAIERVAVGLGPGTFTGLRVGAATARGLARSLGVGLVGVSTLQALARPALRGCGAEDRGVLAVIDARRGEVYVAAHGPEGELARPRALAPGSVGEILEGVLGEGAPGEGTPAAGRLAGWHAVGDGAVRYRKDLEEAGARVPERSSPLHGVAAGAICELALGRETVAAEAIVPDYRRRPDAELALQGAGG
ncbi:MAG TPA: tRNA (adenosine(37)-N6)-threonylcarbamoyltransferase complex dimerization subunit type 1 TsaB [Solirubrobacteraceae bacterium]|nr:tRNA (adenosine(37)-N6)-threonylcarbamoyltransferase complex dimerization subunit type 1 TsaB [Solirubrobacteraceae bacterium]